jgi:hypothetical protein
MVHATTFCGLRIVIGVFPTVLFPLLFLSYISFIIRIQKNNTSTIFYVIEKCLTIPALQGATV